MAPSSRGPVLPSSPSSLDVVFLGIDGTKTPFMTITWAPGHPATTVYHTRPDLNLPTGERALV